MKLASIVQSLMNVYATEECIMCYVIVERRYAIVQNTIEIWLQMSKRILI